MSDRIEITPALLVELKAKAEAAYNGEWLICDDEIRGADDYLIADFCISYRNPAENMAFIAAANPTVVLALVDRIRQLESPLAQKLVSRACSLLEEANAEIMQLESRIKTLESRGKESC